VEFGGVVSKHAKDPYMLTFEEPAIHEVQTKAPDKKLDTSGIKPDPER
jgi:hypothetical protein